MKREIEFRGKRTDNGEWVYGFIVETEYGIDNGHEMLVCYQSWIVDFEFVQTEIIKESVGQFTGLTDKNGVKIFEGDIVDECGIKTEVFKAQRNGVVVFVNFYWSIKWYFGDISIGYHCSNGELKPDLIVIGNIHDPI